MAEWLEKIKNNLKEQNFVLSEILLANTPASKMKLDPKKRYSTIPLIQGLKLSMESMAFCQVKK